MNHELLNLPHLFPTDEEIKEMFTTEHQNEDGRYRKIRNDRIHGAKQMRDLIRSRLQLLQNASKSKPLEGVALEVLNKTSKRVLNYQCKFCGHHPCICNEQTL